MTPTTSPSTTDRETDDGRVDLFAHLSMWSLIGALVVIALVTEGAARIIESTSPPQVSWYDAATQRRVDMLDGRSADVVFAGTSMPWQAFVPDVFDSATGNTSFNAGLAGAVPVVTEPWLLDHVEPQLSPRTVVWGLSTLDFSTTFGAEQERAWNDATETKSGWLADLDRAARDVSAVARLRPLLRRPSELAGLRADTTRHDIADAERVTGPDGERLDFAPNVSARQAAIQRSRLAGASDVDLADADAIRRTVIELRARDVEVIFALLPVPSRFVELHPNGVDDVDDTRSTVAALAGELGVDMVDLSGTFVDRDFVDYTHLDEPSATRFTELFAAASDHPAVDTMEPSTCVVLDITNELGFPIPVTWCRN